MTTCCLYLGTKVGMKMGFSVYLCLNFRLFYLVLFGGFVIYLYCFGEKR